MDRATFINKYWRYYLLLEEKFIDTLNYVELAKENFSTYSVEYAHQLLTVGSELDTFFKIYCGFNHNNRKNIVDYTQYIMSDYPQITTQGVGIYNTEITLTPYEEWSHWNTRSGNLLSWWDAYNLIKHNRQENITKASMENVVTALGALNIIEMKYLQIITKDTQEFNKPENSSSLFELIDWNFNVTFIRYGDMFIMT